ncbi:hypothetical protein D9M72_88390 [compost metagenome]
MTGIIPDGSLRPSATQRGPLHEDQLEVGRNRQARFDTLCGLHQVLDRVNIAHHARRRRVDVRAKVQCPHAIATRVQQVLRLRQAVRGHLELGLNHSAPPRIWRRVAYTTEARQLVHRQQPPALDRLSVDAEAHGVNFDCIRAIQISEAVGKARGQQRRALLRHGELATRHPGFAQVGEGHQLLVFCHQSTSSEVEALEL